MIRQYNFSAITLSVLLALGGVSVHAQGVAPSIQWEKSFGGKGDDKATSIQESRDGGYVVVGSSTSNDADVSLHHGSLDSSDYWILKLDSFGSIQWSKTLGGNGDDEATCVQQTLDGGYIVAGYSNSTDGDIRGNHGGYDCWIVKLDSAGGVDWKKCYGGIYDDRASSIQQTRDRGYILAGSSNSNDGDVSGHHGSVGNVNVASQDCWIVKLDSAGEVLWERSLGGDKQDAATSIQQTRDNGYIVAGLSASNNGQVTGHHYSAVSTLHDMWIVKLNSVGVIEWNNSLGGGNLDQAYGVQQTHDREGGYIVAGLTFSNDGDVSGYHGDGDYCLVKLDTLGTMVWEKSLGGKDNDQAYSVQLTMDTGYVVAGFSASHDGDVSGNHGLPDYWIVETDADGGVLWQHSFGGSGYDWANAIQQTRDSGFVIAGYSNSTDGDVTGNHGTYDFWIVKLRFPPPEIFSSQQETLPPYPCGDLAYDTVIVRNNGGKLLVVFSASFDNPNAGFSLLSPKLPDSVQAGDSLKCIIKFSTIVSGTFGATLNIYCNDPDHGSWPISFTCRKDTVGSAISGVGQSRALDTLDFGVLPCGSSKDTSIMLTNISTIPVTFALRITNSSVFSLPINSATFMNAGEKQSVVIHFAGTTAPGPYSGLFITSDTCGHQDTVHLAATIDGAAFAITSLPNITVCPNDSDIQSFTITNLSRTTQALHGSGGSPLFSISSNSVTLNAGDSSKIQVAFHGTPIVGAYSVTFNFMDACGGTHRVAMNVIVENVPPLTLSLQTDPAAVTMGTQRRVCIIGNPASSVTGGITFTVTNEPTALEFDSIVTPCLTSVVRDQNTNTFSFKTCPAAPSSDTIAVLFYQTLVGSTFAPIVTLQQVATSLACNTVSGTGSVTIHLLPPGCELGTVLVHPISSSIQSMFPNPATGVTTITYSTIENATVNLNVCDALGRTVRTLVNTMQQPGTYTAAFDTDALMNGMYFVKMREGNFAQTKALLMMR